MLALYFVSAALEFAMVGVGLRGGPLETRKRKAMVPLLYLEVALWPIILAFTSKPPGRCSGAAGGLLGGPPVAMQRSALLAMCLPAVAAAGRVCAGPGAKHTIASGR